MAYELETMACYHSFALKDLRKLDFFIISYWKIVEYTTVRWGLVNITNRYVVTIISSTAP